MLAVVQYHYGKPSGDRPVDVHLSEADTPEVFNHGVHSEDIVWPHSKRRDVVQLRCAWMGDRCDEEHTMIMDEKSKRELARKSRLRRDHRTPTVETLQTGIPSKV